MEACGECEGRANGGQRGCGRMARGSLEEDLIGVLEKNDWENKKSFYDDEATSMYILDTLYGRQRNGAY